MTFLIAWSSAAAMIGELVAVTHELAKKEVTGEPPDADLNLRFTELMTAAITHVQKGMMR